MKRWYALHTRSRHEKKVASDLAGRPGLGAEPYLPIVRRLRRWKDRKKEVEFPLFPGYLFVRAELDGEEGFETWEAVRRLDGVVRFVGERPGGPRALPVEDAEIHAVRTVLERSVRVDPWRYSIRVGMKVRVRSGPLAGVEGTVVERKGSRRLVLHVHLIQRAVAVEIGPEDVAF